MKRQKAVCLEMMLPLSASAQVSRLTCRSDVGNLVRKDETLRKDASAVCRAIYEGYPEVKDARRVGGDGKSPL
jgi:hypothetical protein